VQEVITAGMTASGAEADAWRAKANLPLVPTSEVALITADSICTAASVALNRDTEVNPSGSNTAYVIRVGADRFVAFDKSQRAAGRIYVFVYDASFSRRLALFSVN
jgi:hypothetical protein